MPATYKAPAAPAFEPNYERMFLNAICCLAEIDKALGVTDETHIIGGSAAALSEIQNLKDASQRTAAERDALQLRLNAADQRIDELTSCDNEQTALMPVDRSYDVRAKQILAFNTCKQGGGDLDDALGAAYKAALRHTPHPDMTAQPAPKGFCRDYQNCECGGDAQGVIETCDNWVKT
ncbi:hypothetical protein KRR23_05465 [Pseudomonas sp. CVAP|uniref:hypothetical protein n=1 Tax=Pseudomonas sp. CVAP\|nr:hypothetical protein [Pseudomonas sp. CVAP\